MKNINKGFTLIELIIVIVVLGILSVVAAPRFIDISSDAKAAKVESLAASIKSAATLYRMKHKLQDCKNTQRSIDGVSFLHSGAPYAGDWDIENTDNCGYTQITSNNVPEIIETLDIDDATLSSFWMLHTRNNTYPLVEHLYIAPFPAAANAGVRQVFHGSPASNADDLIATQCYILYASAHTARNVDEEVSTVTSGC